MKTICSCTPKSEIQPGLGCLAYRISDAFQHDVGSELMMRAGGLGFGVMLSAEDATMSMHLQANGCSRDEAVELGF